MESKISVAFASIDKEYGLTIPQPIEKEGIRNFITWGEGNTYPEYFFDFPPLMKGAAFGNHF